MSAITSKVEICNLALGLLGNYGTVSDIDVPVDDKELTFAKWYDIVRQYVLKKSMPNFALSRRVVAQVAVTADDFGYNYAYEYPSDCLKVLGLNEIDLKEGDYAVEGNRIFVNDNYDSGAKLRFIRDIETVASFSPEFVMLLANYLAAFTALEITQDPNKSAELKATLPAVDLDASSINAQENPPIRISNSRFRQARYSNVPRNPTKR